MNTTQPTVFKWSCNDCGIKGEAVITFPCTVTNMAQGIRADHQRGVFKFRRLCFGNDITIQPKAPEL